MISGDFKSLSRLNVEYIIQWILFITIFHHRVSPHSPLLKVFSQYTLMDGSAATQAIKAVIMFLCPRFPLLA